MMTASVSGMPDIVNANSCTERERERMSIEKIHQGIAMVELAIKDAGADQAVNAIIDVLKEVARTLEEHGDATNRIRSARPESAE